MAQVRIVTTMVLARDNRPMTGMPVVATVLVTGYLASLRHVFVRCVLWSVHLGLGSWLTRWDAESYTSLRCTVGAAHATAASGTDR